VLRPSSARRKNAPPFSNRSTEHPSLDSKHKALEMVSHRIARSLGFALPLALSISLGGVFAAADSPAKASTSAAAALGPATVLAADSGSTDQWHKKHAAQKGRAASKSKRLPRGKLGSGKVRPKKWSRTLPGGSSNGNSSTTK
jgi:hypothetical protein